MTLKQQLHLKHKYSNISVTASLAACLTSQKALGLEKIHKSFLLTKVYKVPEAMDYLKPNKSLSAIVTKSLQETGTLDFLHCLYSHNFHSDDADKADTEITSCALQQPEVVSVLLLRFYFSVI